MTSDTSDALNYSAIPQAIFAPTHEHGNPMFVYIAEAYIQPVILVFGFLTNIASFVVLRKVRMNEVFRICLVSLSILDAIACLVGFIQLVVEVSAYDGDIPQGYMNPPAIASNTLFYIYMMFMCSAASVVVTIAIIRNIFVILPMKARGWFTTGTTKVICFINFLVTFILFAPVSLKIISQSCEKEVNVSICDWMNSTDPSMNRVASVYAHYFLSALYGPILIIVYIICFVCIRLTVAKSVKQLTLITPRRSTSTPSGSVATKATSTMSEDARVRSRTAKRITKTLLLILILDVICTLPYVIQGMGLLFAKGYGIFNEENYSAKVYDVIVEVFLNLRPTYNFWLYVYQHPEFRIRVRSLSHRIFNPCYKSIVCCPCCKIETVIFTPTRTPKNWSSATNTPLPDKAPWFKRLSSRVQNGRDIVYVPTALVDKDVYAMHGDSMDSENCNAL